MEADSPAKYWDYFDKFYCISLDERADRRGEAKRQFGRIGLLEKVEFVIVKKHSQNIEQGIFNEVKVQPFVDFSKVENVFILGIVKSKEIDNIEFNFLNRQ